MGADGVAKVVEAAGAKVGDSILMMCAKWEKACDVLGEVRLEVGRREKLINEDDNRLLWVTEFPMLSITKKTNAGMPNITRSPLPAR